MANKDSNLKTLKDVIFVYTSVSRAMKQLNQDNKPPLSDSPLEFHAYEVKVLVTEKMFKAMKKVFKTASGTPAKNFPNAKDISAEDCFEKFNVEVDDDMVLIKFAQSALCGPKGNRKEARKIGLIGIKKSATSNGVAYFDKTGNIIAPDTNIGNGTKGHLQFNPVESDFGLYLYPSTICVTELVEYIAEGVEADEDAFGVEEMEEAPVAMDNSEENFDDDDGIPSEF